MYDITAYILCGLLVVGFILNWMIRPVDDKHFMTDEELDSERKLAHEAGGRATAGGPVASSADAEPVKPVYVTLAWLVVGIPILWGVLKTVEKAWVLFK